MDVRSKPTHIMQITIPINEKRAAHCDFDAYQDALRIAMGVSRAAWYGAICGDVNVELREQS